jgi:uncharacterized membrane protein YfcA
MMTVLLCLTAFFASLLTFFSGFGLGTILAPVMMFYFPVEVAIAMTGIVHFLNNIFKLVLTGHNANKDVVLRFGIPAVIAAFVGAYLLIKVANFSPLISYTAFDHQFEIYPQKIIIAVFLIFFALVDIIPYFSTLQFSRNMLPIGGALSGFFGGLTGSQGALRSAFLIKSGMTKDAFIGTTVIISTMVDFTRLSVYANGFLDQVNASNLPIIIFATLSAFIGAFLGNKLLKKVTIQSLQRFVAGFLIVIAIFLGLGWI